MSLPAAMVVRVVPLQRPRRLLVQGAQQELVQVETVETERVATPLLEEVEVVVAPLAVVTRALLALQQQQRLVALVAQERLVPVVARQQAGGEQAVAAIIQETVAPVAQEEQTTRLMPERRQDTAGMVEHREQVAEPVALVDKAVLPAIP